MPALAGRLVLVQRPAVWGLGLLLQVLYSPWVVRRRGDGNPFPQVRELRTARNNTTTHH